MSTNNLNERFTNVADRVSKFLGDWKFSIISFVILLLWTIYGAIIISHQVQDWFTSSQWNFPLNTITTVGEWFIGALCAAATSRAERHLNGVLHHVERASAADERMERDHGIELKALREENKELREMNKLQLEILQRLEGRGVQPETVG